MIRAMCFGAASGSLTTGDESLIAAWLERRERGSRDTLWADFVDEDPQRERAFLCERFGLHPNGVLDAQRHRHPPKIERFSDHLLLLLRGLDPASDHTDLRTIQLALFVGDGFLLTRRSGASMSVDSLWHDVSSGDPGRCDPLALALRITRRMTDGYLGILFQMENRLDQVEEEMLTRPEDRQLTELSGYKQDLTRLRRNFVYHNQAFVRARVLLEQTLEESDLEHDFNDVAEQVDRVGSLADLYYHLASDLIQTYVSLASHRLNGIMKVLTIITAIFVPLSFVAGVYGMNFQYMPELTHRGAYFVVLGFMALIVVALITVFRRKHWL